MRGGEGEDRRGGSRRRRHGRFACHVRADAASARGAARPQGARALKVVVLLLAGLTLTSFLFDVAFRQWLRWRLHEQLEKNRGLRTLTWSMRLRHLLLGALFLALIASVGRTTQDRWII